MKYINYISLLTILLFSSTIGQCETEKTGSAGYVSDAEYLINPGTTKTKVSNLLMGFNLIYPHEKNAIWQDGKIEGYLKDVNVGLLRYPGGTVCSYYHWNSLTGEGWKDSWDINNPVTPKSSTEFMDIDEYISLVKKTGAVPLVGVNVSSGWRWNRMKDGLSEALALMKYCKEKNFKVEYWYLDNEPYQHDSNGGAKTPEEYAGLINTYTPAMKAFDPAIKIVANWNSGFRNKRAEYDKLIRLAGANIDIIDVHWYWSWNNPSWEKWLFKTPMEQWTGQTYSGDIAYFHKMAADLGHPSLKLASFEWNSGPTKSGTFTASRSAMTQTEMMMQFISAGLDYAVFWPIHWPDESSKVRSFVNTTTNTANPDYYIFKFLGKMQGGLLTDSRVLKAGKDIISVTVQDADLGKIRICIMNKADKDQVTEILMDNYPGYHFTEGQVYTVSSDGNSYKLSGLDLLQSAGSVTKFIAKNISITMLTFEKNK